MQKIFKSIEIWCCNMFVGTVRDLNKNKKVTGITYDAKESMVIKV